MAEEPVHLGDEKKLLNTFKTRHDIMLALH